MTARPRVFRWVAGLGLALLLSHGALGADPPPVPMSTFFRNADLSAAHLSPSGRWLAIATVTRSGRIGLATMDLDGSAPPAFVASYVGIADDNGPGREVDSCGNGRRGETRYPKLTTATR